MENIFITVLDMSLTASFLILAILAVRYIFERIPARFLCLLWGAAGLRLILPWKSESSYSLVPKAEVVTPDIVMDRNPAIDSGIPVVDSMVNPILAGSAPDPGASMNPLQFYSFLAAIVWLTVIFILAAAALISYYRLSRKVRTAVSDGSGVWRCDTIDTPFILGMIRPRIYLPADLEEGRDDVIAHEKAHLKRFDHLTKPLAYAVVIVHWFNPLVWIAFRSFCRDVEKACDQRVIGAMSQDQRKDYARTLLRCSAKGSGLMMNPLAFGEVGVKNRIEEILRFIRPSKKYLVFAASLCILVCVFFAAGPRSYGEYQFGGKSLDQMVSEALTRNDTPDELEAEGHKIIGTEEKDGVLKVYVISKTAGYDFIDDKFIEVSGGEPRPEILCFDLEDGHFVEYIGEDFCSTGQALQDLFPPRMRLRTMIPILSLDSQIKAYAKEYLRELGRDAEIGTHWDVHSIGMTEEGISVKACNGITERYGDRYEFYNKTEYLSDGVRYVQEVSLENKNRLVLKTYRYDDGAVMEKIVIRIDGDTYEEESVYRAKEANL